MKVMTILGTRPEIIRLSMVVKVLDQNADHILVHTGQNYDDRLSGLFLRELNVREPDASLKIRSSNFGEQVGQILSGIESLLREHRPDRVLILGDTNSGLAAIVARRIGIPVYHMEAGNRCFDARVPEEANRRIIDHVSSVLMPYTNRSRENLIHEGIAGERIYVTGNPIHEVLQHFDEKIASSSILASLHITEKGFFLITMHRAENVDVEERLRSIVEALVLLHKTFQLPVLCSLHPRTRSKAAQFGINLIHTGLRFLEPFGLFDFVHLEQSAFCVLSDSGTVQEETCILGVPNVIIRDVTERPETIECGSAMLAGSDPQTIVRAVFQVTSEKRKWHPPREYLEPHVSRTVAQIVLGYRTRSFEEMNIPRQQGSPEAIATRS